LSALRRTLSPYLFIAFPCLILLVFHIIPALGSIALSFCDYDGSPKKLPRFIGIDNYVQLFTHDPLLWQVTKNTLVYALSTVPLTILFAFLFALLLNARWLIGRTLLRSIYFIPSVVSIVAIGLVWQWVLNPSLGLMNALLDKFGLPPVGWLGDPRWAMPCVVMVSVWRGLGFSLIIYLAAFQQIPAHYYEAASVDGATGWQQTWHITWPLVSAQTFFLLITGLIGAFQVFDIVFIMTGGGPANATNVLNNHLYAQFTQNRLGYSAAIAVWIFAIIFVMTLGQMRFYRSGGSSPE
jgi:ABC-type sugar transport system permease subunit